LRFCCRLVVEEEEEEQEVVLLLLVALLLVVLLLEVVEKEHDGKHDDDPVADDADDVNDVNDVDDANDGMHLKSRRWFLGVALRLRIISSIGTSVDWNVVKVVSLIDALPFGLTRVVLSLKAKSRDLHQVK
jgi:hypothetical protein